ncbi:unnamed protein product, partial [marine sediment metagenome]
DRKEWGYPRVAEGIAHPIVKEIEELERRD